MSNLDHYCAWCGKKYTHLVMYNGISNCCSRRCAEKLKEQRKKDKEEIKESHGLKKIIKILNKL